MSFSFDAFFVETFFLLLKHYMSLSLLESDLSSPRLYLHEDGLVRFATESYSEEGETLKNPFVHLTNYALNRTNQDNQEPQGKRDF